MRCGLKCNEHNSSINFQAAARFSNPRQRQSKKKTNTHKAMNYCSCRAVYVWCGAKGHTGNTTNRRIADCIWRSLSLTMYLWRVARYKRSNIVAIIRPCNAVWSESQCDCWPFSAINVCVGKSQLRPVLQQLYLRYTAIMCQGMDCPKTGQKCSHLLKQKIPKRHAHTPSQLFIKFSSSYNRSCGWCCRRRCRCYSPIFVQRSFAPVLRAMFFIVSSLKCANKMKLQHDTLSIADETQKKTERHAGRKKQTLEIRSTLSGSDKGETVVCRGSVCASEWER